MTCTKGYREHIEYTFHAFCKVVIRNASINAADALANYVPSILKESTQKVAKRFLTTKKLRSTYPKAFELLEAKVK